MADNRELALVLKLVADQFQSELKKSGGLLGEFQKFVGDWKTQLAAAGTVLFAIAKSTATYGDELVKMGQRMGTSIADTARLQHAAKLADADLHSLSSTVGILSREMVNAAAGNTEAEQKFRQLGISVRDAGGGLKSTTAILLEISDKFRSMPDGPEKTGLAMLALGKSAQQVLPFLSSNLREAFKEADQLGVVMSEKDAKAGERFNDELTKLQQAVRGVTNDVGTALIPVLTQLTSLLTTIIVDAHKAAQALSELLFSQAQAQSQVGVVQPEGGGPRLRIMPKPSDEELKKFSTTPFFKTPEQAAQQAKTLGDEEVRRGREQVRLGQAKLELFNAQTRALEIQFRLQQGLPQDFHVTEQQRVAQEIVKQTQLAVKIRDDAERAEAARQERRGRMIVEQTQLEVAIQQRQMEMQQRGPQGFFEGWVAGMQKYVQATDSAFGLAADMARRTAQAMEQNFRQFFFDLFENRVRTLGDLLKSLSQFVSQIASQIAGQLATRAVLGGLGLGGPLGMGFATGGSFTVGGFGGTDSQPVFFRATPGERVSVETPGQQRAQAPVAIVINNYGNNDVSATSGRGPDGRQTIYVTVRDMVRGMIQSGEIDKSMRSRYNLSPGGV